MDLSSVYLILSVVEFAKALHLAIPTMNEKVKLHPLQQPARFKSNSERAQA